MSKLFLTVVCLKLFCNVTLDPFSEFVEISVSGEFDTINPPPPLGPKSNKPPLFSELGFWRYRFWGLPPSAAENFGILGSLYKGETRRRRKKILRFMLCTRGKIVQKFAKILADSEFQQTPPLVSPDFGPKGGVYCIELP